MKICFYCDSAFSFGGVQKVLSTVSKGLSINHDITILTLDNPFAEDRTLYGFTDSSVKFEFITFDKLPFRHYFPCKLYSFLYKRFLPKNKLTSHYYGKSSFPLSHRKKLAEVINRNGYDVVVGVHAFRSLNLTAIAKQIHTATIGWLHTSYDGFFNTRGLYLWDQKKQFKHAMPLLDATIVLTNSDKRLFDEKMRLNTTVIYNPLSEFPAYKCHVRTKKFLAVGRLCYSTKGFDVLIKAFALYAKKDKEWLLNIVGEGPEEQSLRKLIKELHLESRVFIHPFTRDIQKYYSTSGVFVLSSRWEGLPLVLVEAMAHGLPVIASDLPVVREILCDKKNVLIYKNNSPKELSDRMFEITNSCDLEVMGKESHKVAQRFTPVSALRQWEELLHTCQSKHHHDGFT